MPSGSCKEDGGPALKPVQVKTRTSTPEEMRLDKWLWAARLFKTRSLAAESLELGRVQVNGQSAKPSKAVRVGDTLEIRQPGGGRTLVIQGLSHMRGPASVAQGLYQETPESQAKRQAWQDLMRSGAEPARHFVNGRPTKKDRRTLQDWQRWSASVEPS